MDQATFVNLLRHTVTDSVASDMISQIQNPPGRNISEERKRRAAWFASLSEEDREYVRYALNEAAHAVAFGFLCVLDGSRAIQDHPKQGHLELNYVSADTATLLASSATDAPILPLHELF